MQDEESEVDGGCCGWWWSAVESQRGRKSECWWRRTLRWGKAPGVKEGGGKIEK